MALTTPFNNETIVLVWWLIPVAFKSDFICQNDHNNTISAIRSARICKAPGNCVDLCARLRWCDSNIFLWYVNWGRFPSPKCVVRNYFVVMYCMGSAASSFIHEIYNVCGPLTMYFKLLKETHPEHVIPYIHGHGKLKLFCLYFFL